MAKRVAVLGVGSAGLAALHRVTTADQSIDVVAFERYGEVGGLWVYTDKTGIDDDGLPVHASMYKNVRANLPKECMKFFDFPHKDPFPSFMTHDTIRDYLQSYADHFDLHRYIKYKTIVTRVHPVTPELRHTKWEVTYCKTDDQENKTTEVFDYVMICTGHNAVPNVLSYSGIDNFKGEIVTSHDYRVPETFTGKNVACIGSGPSALDLASDLGGVANKVFLSMDKARRLLEFTLPEVVLEKPDFDHVTENSIVFADGSEEKVDVILLCTGYLYAFPFLTDSCKVVIEDNGKRVTPLYKHMVNIEYPNMFFIGIQDFSNNISVNDVSAQFAACVISGAVALPSKEDMETDTKKDFEAYLKTGNAPRYYHTFVFRQFDVMDSLFEMMNKPKLPKGYRLLFEEIIRKIMTETQTYRDLNCEVLGDSYRFFSSN